MPADLLELTSSLAFLDDISTRYQQGDADVDPSWTPLLAELPRVATPTAARSTAPAAGVAAAPAPMLSASTATVWPLVDAYRQRGHLAAQLDPLGLLQAADVPELAPATWGLDIGNAATIAPTGVHGLPRATLAQLVAHLQATYAGTVGLEFMHIASPVKRAWLAARMETSAAQRPAAAVRRRMLEQLIQAEGFERFCHVKYPGTKRFSLEGSEPVIPLLDLALDGARAHGAVEAVIGMAHRGRLTALEVIMRRAAREIFAEFEDVEPEVAQGGGDVKYHLGYSSDRADGMHVSLSFNPSHLEAVDPVVLGRVRAKQFRAGDAEHKQVVGVLVHGDAAFAGQGLVPECFNLANLPGYCTGGTIHVIINNQVGFTASPAEARSTPYCTDVAKMIECPIWHVNGEDLDAVARVVEMAAAYRAEFGSDVVIDLYGYRKYGHNEMDEPGFTQPLMYDRIQKMDSVVDSYARRLIADGEITEGQVTELVAARARQLEAELAAGKAAKQRPRVPAMAARWRGYQGGTLPAPLEVATGVEVSKLAAIAQAMTTVPAGFTPHPKIVRLLEQRAEMGAGKRPLDWGMGELLAYGALLLEQRNVRLSGQDCCRGTFSHRHAVITDVRDGSEHNVLSLLAPQQGVARVFDSPLSEAGVMGFEFGFSLDYPDALVMWEAQFGDFANGAQVIIDQFIVASEDKWNRLSGLVLLLPHGFEGQGPEHSSARLERFLEACGEHNIQVAQPTTPAQMFHLLRRQVLSSWRKPLVVMTPKSLLRLPAASSTLDELATGTFQHVIGDAAAKDAKAAKAIDRALLCTGKIYYELEEQRRKRGDDKLAIIRVEQLYPWWPELIDAALRPYGALKSVAWVQDEPTNMGAATFVEPRLAAVLRGLPTPPTLSVVARAESASPATGSHKAHGMEQERIFQAAFAR